MLKINSNAANLDLRVLGYIRLGKVTCATHKHVLVAPFEKVDALYGREARGQCCEVCGAVLYQEVEHVQAVSVAAAG